MSAMPPTPVLQKSVAVPRRLVGPEHEAALDAASVTDELTTSVVNHVLYGNPRPTVTNAQISAILNHYDLSEPLKSQILNRFPLPAGGAANELQRVLDRIVNEDNKRYGLAQPAYDGDVIDRLYAIASRVPRWVSPQEETVMKTLLEKAKKNRDITKEDHKIALADLKSRPSMNPNQTPVGPNNGGFKRKSQTERFSRCVKMVRRSVKPLPGSNKESAAIAICTKTILHKRGRTIKRYSKKRLVTQRKK
jgi:hypothetical protein